MPIADLGHAGEITFLGCLVFPPEELEEVVWTELS